MPSETCQSCHSPEGDIKKPLPLPLRQGSRETTDDLHKGLGESTLSTMIFKGVNPTATSRSKSIPITGRGGGGVGVGIGFGGGGSQYNPKPTDQEAVSGLMASRCLDGCGD